MPKFLPTSGFKWTDPKGFNSNKYTNNSSKGCVLEVNLEYPKELRQLHNNYPLAQDKIEIEREMLSNYQLKIADYPTTIFYTTHLEHFIADGLVNFKKNVV